MLHPLKSELIVSVKQLWRHSWVMFLWLVALSLVAPSLSGQTETDDSTQQSIHAQIALLGSDSYVIREHAKQRLLLVGQPAIGAVVAAFEKADIDLANQLSDLLSQLATDAESPTTIEIVEKMRRFASEEGTTRGAIAAQLIRSIRELHSERALGELLAMGAKINIGGYALNGRSGGLASQYIYVEFNDKFAGSSADMVWLNWLNQVDLVVFNGSRFTGEWLRYLKEMPSLRFLVIRHASLTDQDLVFLEQIEQLDHLELLYVPITDQSVSRLSGMAVNRSMRLFGTRISDEGAKKISDSLDGIEFTFGHGGFLGIQSDQAINSTKISLVTPGGAAEKAGLQTGDTILEINGKPVASFDDIRANLRPYSAGERVPIVVERFNEQGRLEKRNFDVILGEQPTT